MWSEEKEMNETYFINTLLQQGAETASECDNRFKGFPRTAKTVETVLAHSRTLNTQLKQGVNESTIQRFN